MSKFKTKLLGSFLLGIFMLTPSLGFSDLHTNVGSPQGEIEVRASTHGTQHVPPATTNSSAPANATKQTHVRPSGPSAATTHPSAPANATKQTHAINPSQGTKSPPPATKQTPASTKPILPGQTKQSAQPPVKAQRQMPPVSAEKESLDKIGLRAQSTSPVESQGKLVGWHGGGGGWRGGGGGWGGRGVYGGGWGGGYRNYGYGYGYPSYSYSYPSYSYSYPYYSSYYYW